jgi:hypothetical protein
LENALIAPFLSPAVKSFRCDSGGAGHGLFCVRVELTATLIIEPATFDIGISLIQNYAASGNRLASNPIKQPAVRCEDTPPPLVDTIITNLSPPVEFWWYRRGGAWHGFQGVRIKFPAFLEKESPSVKVWIILVKENARLHWLGVDCAKHRQG